ncbi:MAG: hypothetical protein IKW57_04655 [Alphaproteobacteria bacterium]|nr:hypothetical protein [Alphaproteobacteria bacterium]
MRYINSILFYSLLSALVPGIASAGIRVGNLSRSNAAGYQQVNQARTQAELSTAAAVNTENVGTVQATEQGAIVSDAATNAGQMDRCSMIYPNGEFSWSRPTLGRGIGGASTCTAVVEMRAIGAGVNGADLVVARGNVSAGDSIRCNISDFSELTWLPAAGQVEFPADSEPTMDDVISVMNQEQKQNAGIKIAAGAVLGGLGGNVAGKNEPGHDGLLGGGKAKTKNTVIGALGGAALMAGNAFTGKVAGDMILSTGVNAAAGAVMGNIVANGDSVMRIEPCTVDGTETTCLWGFVEKTSSLGQGENAYVSATNIDHFRVCKPDTANSGQEICTNKDLTNVVVAAYKGLKSKSDGQPMELTDMLAEGFEKSMSDAYCFDETTRKMVVANGGCERFIKLESASVVDKRTAAMVVGIKDKATGWKRSDWAELKSNNSRVQIVGRTGTGTATNLPQNYTMSDFRPAYIDASDGGVVDLSNKARLKGTLTGAGVGAGMGAFVGYQGAQSDIENRWVTAVREYKDSLGKVYCATGTRFLSQYNDTVIIPEMSAE